MRLKFYYAIVGTFLITEPSIAKKSSHHHQWQKVIPDITKELLPPETQQEIEKVFPPKGKMKSKHANGIDAYEEEITLKGELSLPVHIYGSAVLKSVQTKKTIEIDDSTVMENSNVSQLIAHGPLQATTSKIQILKAMGPVKLKDCKVTQKATIHGNLNAKKTTFQGPLNVKGDTVILKSSSCQDIVLLSSSILQKVFLENTKVDGKIIFEGKPGEVIIQKNSQITGKIKNGNIRTE